MKDVLVKIVHDTRKAKKNGTFPVKLRLTYNRERKYYPTEYSLSVEDFALTKLDKPKGRYLKMQVSFEEIVSEARRIIKGLPVFSFYNFEKQLGKSTAKDDVFEAYNEKINQLKSDGQIRTAKNYESASISLLSFLNKIPLTRNKGLSRKEADEKRQMLLKKKKSFSFSGIDPTFLKDYDKWMVENGKSVTTISMYLRCLRTLFNEAISLGDIHRDLYPFGKKKYNLPASRNIKKALTKDDVHKIFHFNARSESEEKARDYWCFSYLCNGINIKDIARLKYNQVDGDFLTFVRAKTERTTRHDQKTNQAHISPKAAQIINRWGNKPKMPSQYVFPILTNGLSPEKELATVRQTVKTINKYMGRIGQELGIEMKITTYTARHTFSTVLKRANVSTAEIMEALGHSSERTTQNYLASFEDDAKRKITSILTDF